MARKIFVITTLLTVFLIFFSKKTKINQVNQTKLVLNSETVNLEVANDDQSRATGLSNRPSLCSNCGMLFVFDQSGIYTFWMKDTLIPLDMLWVDKNYKIVDIKTAQPEPNKQLWELQLYQNIYPAKYVIELNQDFAKKHNLKIGDQLELQF